MKVLVIAPHPDDEILGAGGTIAKRSAAGDAVYVCIVTRGAEPLYRDADVRVIQQQCREADSFLGARDTLFLDHPAVMLETVPRYTLNGSISDVVQKIAPDEVYIPHRGDMQIDHKMVVDAAMVALRPRYAHVVKRIYAYETLSETNWDLPTTTNAFLPTVYEDISATLEAKKKAMSYFPTQLAPFPNARSIEAIEALAAFRGATVSVNAAEAFMLIRELK